ncbi:ABC transporter ATP-binding protein [Maritimibacter sp. 55A14]|uniref:ATP-binding cassette domain-containing protein n=1 Tax=Maritimibacter sp. 55A14 TaxID=2174844 RepID=UPI000D607E33|nr:ATP-binding cassette domain-containing protein [Maritimibacter sp. 55A14]PWE33644.1 ABC transporter ATP-binding protein [Maritimibacter sp. 55A14]
MHDVALELIDDSGQTRPADSRAGTILEARGLSFDAGGQRLIDDVTLPIRQGRRTVLLGPNGAGKSLLLRLLHGLIAPSEGAVLWRGRPLDRTARRAQAMVFQRPVLLRRSVLANIRFALGARGMRGAERRARAAEALETARLTDLARRPARVLSGGEQQRLALVRALACEPEILLLDEPTSSLDPASTHAIEDLINAANARGVSVLLITHDLGQARRMGDDLVFLHGGRVAETGDLRQCLRTPQSEPLRAWLDGRLHFDQATS